METVPARLNVTRVVTCACACIPALPGDPMIGPQTRLPGTRPLCRPDLVNASEVSGCCFPDVSMVQSADPRQRFHAGVVRFPLDWPAKRRVLAEPEVGAVFVIVVDVLASDPPHVRRVEHDHAVETLAASTANPSLRPAVLPGTSNARARWFDARGFQQIQYFGAEFAVAVEDSVSVRTGIREGLA